MQTHGYVTRRVCKWFDWRKRKKASALLWNGGVETTHARYVHNYPVPSTSADINKRAGYRCGSIFIIITSYRRATRTIILFQLHATRDKVITANGFSVFGWVFCAFKVLAVLSDVYIETSFELSQNNCCLRPATGQNWWSAWCVGHVRNS